MNVLPSAGPSASRGRLVRRARYPLGTDDSVSSSDMRNASWARSSVGPSRRVETRATKGFPSPTIATRAESCTRSPLRPGPQDARVLGLVLEDAKQQFDDDNV